MTLENRDTRKPVTLKNYTRFSFSFHVTYSSASDWQWEERPCCVGYLGVGRDVSLEADFLLVTQTTIKTIDNVTMATASVRAAVVRAKKEMK